MPLPCEGAKTTVARLGRAVSSLVILSGAHESADGATVGRPIRPTGRRLLKS
jgi:hypothetical protein